MKDFPPNINSRLTTIIATVLGFLVIDDFTVIEQVAIGNWMIQIGQSVITNATYQNLLEARILGDERININSKEFKQGGCPFIYKDHNMNMKDMYNALKINITEQEIIQLQKLIKDFSEEIEKMKEELNSV
jgi:hypothetical protein